MFKGRWRKSGGPFLYNISFEPGGPGAPVNALAFVFGSGMSVLIHDWFQQRCHSIICVNERSDAFADTKRCNSIPHQNFKSGSTRFLHYAYGYTTNLVDGYGDKIPQETWVCNMTFEVREGIVADYRSDGNYCRTAAENLPYGRPSER
jgi:hypothetical protein